ncbi:MAG: glycosyltransferase family 2 protein [Anaerolineae bacterium]|nr:glycosyltransferase family 2 protein [Anaerolineae bacterium]
MNAPLHSKVTVVILNTNRREDTLECLASVTASDYPALSVLVLDNASTDGSVEAIRSRFPAVRIEPITDNRGYAGNNNVGIDLALQAGADWVLVLNEDTTLSADCITHMVEAGESDPSIGATGPKVYHYSEPRVIQSAGARADARWRSRHIGENELDEGQYDRRCDVDWISGCAILLRRAALEQVGGFDASFFYYNEETELCYRLRKAGWRVVYEPQAQLWHKGVKRDYEPSPSVAYYAVRNQLMFLRKHHAPLPVKLANWLDFSRTIMSWTIKRKWAGRRQHRDAALQAIGDYFRGRSGKRPG